MLLYITPNSPYARIARIAVRETGLLGGTKEIDARLREDDNPVLDHSPVGRVPTLVTPSGQVVTEVRYVIDAIAEMSGLHALRSATPDQADEVQTEGLALGFLEGVATWVRENRRGAIRSDRLASVEAGRCNRCLVVLEGKVRSRTLPPLPAFAPVVVLVALDLLDMHDLQPSWRDAHPSLGWRLDEARERGSFQATRPDL